MDFSSSPLTGTSLPPTVCPQPQPDAPWGWSPATASLAAWDVSLLRLQGPDSLRFLHGQTSQAIELASPGQWLSTCCISPTARMRALAEVLVNGDGAWLVIHGGDGLAVRQALDRVLFPADAVALGPLLHGLLLEPLPTPVASDDPRPWRPLEGGEGFWLGSQLLLVGATADAQGGESLESAAQELLKRPRLTGSERERWRIQSGLPSCPAELNDDTNPFELGLAGRVSLNKGCYVGQETLAKLATYDGVRQQLRRWFVPDRDGPSPGDALLLEGDRAGRITSALCLPDHAGWIGLALVRRVALDAERLEVERAGACPLPVQLSRPDRFVPPPVGAGAPGRSGR
jgi:folate-binding protein YgfZ